MTATVGAQYKVYVDDNYHYMDESERFLAGVYSDCNSAIAKCKEIVDDFLLSSYTPGMTAGELCSSYTLFGEDPFIVTTDTACEKFSAWTYAEGRCAELCGRSRM